MATSQNGYKANDPSLVSSRLIPGTQVKVTVRKGAAGDLLLYAAGRWDREVEDIDNGRGGLDDWGYAERNIRGGTELSNHASGTAVDLNATQHPLGTAPIKTFTTAQIQAIRRIVADCGRALRWGGDYAGRADPMHLEVVADEKRCAQVLVGLTGGPRSLRKDDRGPDVYALQERLRARFPDLVSWSPSTEYFGDLTDAAVRAAQERLGLAADGIVGPLTRAGLGL